jgi:formylmethanofuran dehydrogenase subunit E
MLPTTELETILERSAAMHDHLCPRQVLGARMGLYARELLGADATWRRKRLFVFVETDGCFADGVSAATNCWLGHRTMRLVDQGKVAATFVDTDTGRAVRIVPQPTSRTSAVAWAPGAPDRWHAQRDGYRLMPAGELLQARPVSLIVSMGEIVSEPRGRSNCSRCGEEVINHRETYVDGQPRCLRCAGLDLYFEEMEPIGVTSGADAVSPHKPAEPVGAR